MLKFAISVFRMMGWSFIVLACGSLLTGCGSGERIYRLSGKATYQGKPIPEGYIVFEPDSSNGNSGAAGRCKILDGKFDTNQEGRGTVGGPHKVRIVGLNAKIGGGSDNMDREVGLPVPLFKPYEVAVDLPKQDSTYDFDVPSS